MSITTYTELQTAITRWLGGRTDLTTYYPDWITLFEAVANRRLRTWEMEKFATLTSVTPGTFLSPTDFLAVKTLISTASGTPQLEYRDSTWAAATFPGTSSGIPMFYSFDSDASATVPNPFIKVYPSDDSDLTLAYYQTIPPLVTNSLNWLLTAHPDLYLFGALTEAHSFLADDQQLMVAKARRDELLDEIDKRQFNFPTGMSMHSFGATP